MERRFVFAFFSIASFVFLPARGMEEFFKGFGRSVAVGLKDMNEGAFEELAKTVPAHRLFKYGFQNMGPISTGLFVASSAVLLTLAFDGWTLRFSKPLSRCALCSKKCAKCLNKKNEGGKTASNT